MSEELNLFDRVMIFIFQVIAVLGVIYTALVVAFGIVFGIVYDARQAFGRDLGQWQDSPVKEWYQTLMQPDNPGISCCGEADAYWCDDISVKDGKTFCALTDDREIKGRPSLPIGMKVEIPDRKLKYDKGNPTGHAVVFLSSGGAVYCFVQGALI